MSQYTDSPQIEIGEYGLHTKQEYGFSPNGDGVVVAIVEWDVVDGVLTAFVEAPNEEYAALLPSPDSGLGEVTASWGADGKLIPLPIIMEQLSDLYRIDDGRPGQDHSYVVWRDDGRTEGPRLLPRTVYHFFEPQLPQALTDFDEVWALISHPDAHVITDVGAFESRNLSDPEVSAAFDADSSLLVWDLHACKLNAERRPAD